MKIALQVPAVLPADTPPIRCELHDGVWNGLANIVGNILGLQSLGIVIVGVLVVVLIIVAVAARARAAVLRTILIIIGILVLGTLAYNLLPQFLPNAC